MSYLVGYKFQSPDGSYWYIKADDQRTIDYWKDKRKLIPLTSERAVVGAYEGEVAKNEYLGVGSDSDIADYVSDLVEQNGQLTRALREAVEAPVFDPDSIGPPTDDEVRQHLLRALRDVRAAARKGESLGYGSHAIGLLSGASLSVEHTLKELS